MLRGLLDGVSFGDLPIEADVYPDNALGDQAELRLSLKTKDVNPPHQTITVNQTSAFRPYMAKDFPNWLRLELLRLYSHEIEEQLTFDGRRVFDPHRHERRAPPDPDRERFAP